MTDFSQHLTKRTPGAPHLRNTISVNGILLTFVVMSVPCLLFGIWSYGATRVEVSTASIWLEFWAGLSTIGPRLTVILAIAYAISLINSRLRQQPMDLGWLPAAWFFVLLLPPDFSLLPSIFALSAALAFGLIAFGGPGMTPFNTSILALMLLMLAGGDTTSSWYLAVQAAIPAEGNLLTGGLPGAIGAMSPLLILLAGVLLVLLGHGSAKTLVSGIAGLLIGAWIFPEIQGGDEILASGYRHLLVGHFLFVLVFIAMDPSCQALTTPARWFAGLGYGLLVAAFRLVDPTHPEGSIPALLLIQLATPLVDAAVVRFYAWQRRRIVDG